MRRLLVALALFITGAATGAGGLAAWTARGDSPGAMTSTAEDPSPRADDASTLDPTAPPPGPFGTPRAPTVTPTPAFAPGVNPPSPSPTPAPPTTRGVATPAGTFVLLRGNALTLARLDRAGPEYELNAGGNGPRGFAGSSQTPAGLELYFTESTSATATDGQSPVSLHRLPAGGGSPVRIVEYSFLGRFAAESASVSRDGRFVAYSSADGLHVRDLRSGGDRLVVPSPCTPDANAPRTEPRPAVGFAGCGSIDVRPTWSPDARYLLFQRLYIEGSRWHIIDLLADSPEPLPMPWQFVRSWGVDGSAVCATDGDGYAGPPRAAFAYEFATSSARWLAVTPRDVPPGAIVLACARSSPGEFAVTYGSYSDGVTRLVLFNERLRIRRSLSSGGDAVAWLPDASGVVLRGVTVRGTERREPFYLVDGNGDLWSLAIDADEVVAILP